MTMTEDKRSLIEANRKRYEDLKAAGQGHAPRALPPATQLGTASLDASAILSKTIIPGGWYDNISLRAGTTLRLINLSGKSSVSLIAWNRHDVSERINHADTIKVQWSASMQKGRIILSDMGRVMFSIVEDTCGAHDCVVGGSTDASTRRTFGGDHRNTRDNFILAAGKFGLARADIPLPISFFAPVGVDEHGKFTWTESKRRTGDFIDLHAEMDLLIAISNCPHPLDPAITYEPGPIEALVLKAAANASNHCRAASIEATRAFENTQSLASV